jgi:DNA repair exonuclease SbcCD ATPase subunit
MMTGVIAILVIIVAVVGSALSAPKRVISGDSEPQDSIKNQQAELVKQQTIQQQQQAELEKRQAERERQQAFLERRAAQKQQAELVKQQATQQQQAELEKRQAELERQQAFLERRAAQKQQAELVKQQATQRVHPDPEREQAAKDHQSELERQQAELEKRQAELERQQFLLEKRAVQTLKARLEKQQAEIEKQLAELEKKQAELNQQEPTFASPNPTAATSLSCDAAGQIIANLGFEKVKAELCTGDTYRFAAMRNGKSFSIEIAAANGEVKNVPAEALAVVANQVRLQGHKCDKPSAIERDVFLSKPGLPVWLLTCGNGRYRVELIPHKQARVTPLN